MQVDVYVENGVAMAYDAGVAAWVFNADHWGACGQGRTEAEALADLKTILPAGIELCVVERVQGDERAFGRDRVPATEDEIERTLAILATVRGELLGVVRNATDAQLDQAIPQEAHFAGWSTIRERAWHIADTESRYYLPSLGLPAKPRTNDLITELCESAAHLRTTLRTMPRNLCREGNGEMWTSTKLLRRLAWHERGELAVIREVRGD